MGAWMMCVRGAVARCAFHMHPLAACPIFAVGAHFVHHLPWPRHLVYGIYAVNAFNPLFLYIEPLLSSQLLKLLGSAGPATASMLIPHSAG